MMRKSFLAVIFATFFLPLPSIAAPEYSSVLPGLAELYKEAAPSDLDKKLSDMADDLTPPKDIKELIAFTIKPLLILGKAHYEAKRKCISDGIVAGYTVGVAGGLWSVNPLFVEQRLQMKVGPGGNKCTRIFYAYYNAAVIRGYIEVRELPQKTRLDWADHVTAVNFREQLWLPGTRGGRGADGITYTGGGRNDQGNLDWYYSYAHGFHKCCVTKINTTKDFDVKAILQAVKDGWNY
jgi:hypothetical protein